MFVARSLSKRQGAVTKSAAALHRSAVRMLMARRMSSQPVPVIDLGPYLDGTDKQGVADKINKACTDIGFLSIVNHGVPQELIDRTWKVTESYFDLNADEKNLITMNESYPYGYSGFAEENLGKGYGEKTLPDLKECFAVGPSNPAAGMPPVQWPQNPAEMQAVWTEYYGAMETLSSNLLKLCGLRLDEDWFEDKITRHRSCLRALNYPHQDKTPEAGQIRAGAHTDYGSLTILAQDDAGGLQVRNATGEWQDIEPTPGAYVINLGDLMARWTNDRWVSTLHRVVNPQDIAGITARRGTTRRQSMAFFHNINHDHLVECIPTCASASNPVKYEPILAWDHLMGKHLASVGQDS